MQRRSFLEMLAIGAVIPVEAFAQDGALAANITATKMAVTGFHVLAPSLGAASASVDLAVQTAGGVDVVTKTVVIPNPIAPTLTVLSLITAMMTTRSGETGNNARKMTFRVIGELFDKGALPEINAVNP